LVFGLYSSILISRFFVSFVIFKKVRKKENRVSGFPFLSAFIEIYTAMESKSSARTGAPSAPAILTGAAVKK
jgi:hypothetical protein